MNTKRLACAAIAFLSALGLASGGVLAAGGQASAQPLDDEQLFLHLVNQVRTDHGLPALTVDRELTAEARAWAATMAGNDQLAHSADISRGISSPWTVLGENVGRHEVHEVDELFRAFVASPTHYQNLVDPRFAYIGVGVVHGTGEAIWTTHRFMAIEPAEQATADPAAGEPTEVGSPTGAASPPATAPLSDPPSTVDEPPPPAAPQSDLPSTVDEPIAGSHPGPARWPCHRCRSDGTPSSVRPAWLWVPPRAFAGPAGRPWATAEPGEGPCRPGLPPSFFSSCSMASR